jgi:uncharacterized damage-inducible protein DinB
MNSKETTDSDEASKFRTKAEYLELYDKTRDASIAALDQLSDAQLDEPSPESLRAFCPTVGDTFVLIANHPMMHVGQLVPVRRQLGKPVKI